MTLPEAPDWYAWRDAFIVGRTGVERTGTLEYLSPDLRSVVARIEFSGLGIHSLVRERSEEGAERLRRVQASIYCENLSYGPVVAAPQTDSRPFGPPSRVAVGASLAAERPAVRSESPDRTRRVPRARRRPPSADGSRRHVTERVAQR